MERAAAVADSCELAGDELTEADVLDTIDYFVNVDTAESLATPTGSSGGSSSNISSPLTLDGDDSGGDTHETTESGQRSAARACIAKATAAAARPHAHKHSQKQELAYLKAKVRELELELRRVGMENDEKLAQEGDSLWQRVAQQQSIERQKSLSENARLKEQLEAQIKFSKSLEKIIRKRPNLTAFGDTCTAFEQRKRRSAASERNLQARLMACAEREYTRTDAVLRDIGASELFKDHRSVNIRVRKAHGSSAETICVESIEVRRFPFPFQSVAREWWTFIAQASHLEQLIDGLSRKVESTSDAHFATTNMQFPVGNGVAVLNASAAIRRFDSDDRTVFAYVSQGDCGAKRNLKSRFAVHETGWIRLMPLPGSPESCILQSVGIFTPTHCCATKLDSEDPGASESDERERCVENAVEAGILSEVIYTAYQKTANYIYAVIENALMEEHLQHRHGLPQGSDGMLCVDDAASEQPPAAF